MARPWTKWYFADWRSDPKLKMCGLPARGLWADILGYMHEGDPYGHFTIEGRVPELPDIAKLVGAPVRDVAKAYAELERYGVFSRTAQGVPYSRRMLKDMERDALNSERGKLGGNPALKAVVNPSDKAQIPETRHENQKDSEASPLPAAGPLDLKRELWARGKSFLQRHDIGAERAGSLLGKWRQSHSDMIVLNVLADAEANCVSEPIAYIEQLLKRQTNGSGSGLNGRAPSATARIAGKIAAARAEQERRSDIRET